MVALDIRHLFRAAWLRAKETEKVSDDDPIAEHVQESVVRSIAELEVARLQRTDPVPLAALPFPIAEIPIPLAESPVALAGLPVRFAGAAEKPPDKNEQDPTLPAVA